MAPRPTLNPDAAKALEAQYGEGARRAPRAGKRKVFQPSPQQADFLDWVEYGQGSCLLEAVAGAGKTTTLVQALLRMEGKVFFGAYNKKIAQEIKAKAKEARADRPGVFISTMHGAGFSHWTRVAPKVNVDDRKVGNIVKEMIRLDETVRPYAAFINKMVSFGKQYLVGAECAMDSPVVWNHIREHYGTDDLVADGDIGRAMLLMLEAYQRSADQVAHTIDFDDMIFAPIYKKVRFFQNDWVLIDECQDVNPARRRLARLMLKPQGRLVAVGDSRQAIYGFCHPPGTLVRTPSGRIPIEQLKVGDAVIVSHADGQIQGWSGGNEVLQVHRYHHSGLLLTLHAGERRVRMTPHHKVPARWDPSAQYYTYMMRRQGVYRVGRCKAYAETKRGSSMFMLAMRYKQERAEAAWLLAAHASKEDAIKAEARLLQRIKGCTFSTKTDAQVAALPNQEAEALKILGEHGRMVDFPLLHPTMEHRFARNAAFVTEACNLMDGMRAAFFDEAQDRGRQNFTWTPIEISARPYSGPVHGITVRPPYARRGFRNHPLYFAGDDILVHNTGAGSDAVERISETFKCKRMPLTVTYRCPKAVVRHAQQWVNHIQAHPNAPEGVVRAVAPAKLDEQGQPVAGPWFMHDRPSREDAVLCRYTRPLVQTAFAMLKAGIACRIEGRDIGKNLAELAQRWRIKTLEKLDERLGTHLENELAKDQPDSKKQAVEDMVGTLRVFMERMRALGKRSIAELVADIESLFADEVNGVVVLSTGHKAKGREWPRVYWIQAAQRIPNLMDWELVQEGNLKYVICTRAQSELVLVPEGV